ncbi:hypothetical protein N9J98_03175 [Flavobacteriaceae bacterium]|nr:hypothetical protein [Flavobacteriaceae bacterium]
MKNLQISLIFILTYFISYSQIGFGLGYESSSNNELNTAIKFNVESLSYNKITYKGFIIGLDFGINFIENDKTGDVGLNNNPQDETGKFSYTILTPGFRLGYQLFSNKKTAAENKYNLFLVGAAGLNMVQEYREFNSSSKGIYLVETDYKKNSPYFRVGLNYVKGLFSPGIGYGTNGFYISTTIYSNKEKIKSAIKNRINKKEIKGYSVAGKLVSKLKWKKILTYVDLFIDDCKLKGINVNSDKIIAAWNSELGENVIAKSEGKDNDELIEIYFNKKEWRNLNINKKLHVLYKELGRDVLNLDYNEAEKMTLNSIKESYTYDEFAAYRESMFIRYFDILRMNEESETRRSRIIEN